jgi:hypothetical protein
MKSELTFGWRAPHLETTTMVAVRGLGARHCAQASEASSREFAGVEADRRRLHPRHGTGESSLSAPHGGRAQTAREAPIDGAARSDNRRTRAPASRATAPPWHPVLGAAAALGRMRELRPTNGKLLFNVYKLPGFICQIVIRS